MSGPFGDKVKKKAPDPPPEWTDVPGKPYLEINRKGQLRTRLPLLPPGQPKGKP